MSFFHLTQRIPPRVCVALSGGVDSMVALDFALLMRADTVALHFNHNNPDSDKYQSFVESYCASRGVRLITERIKSAVPKGRSREDFWRQERYAFFEKVRANRVVVTGHHLGDAVETWVFSSLKGNPKVMPFKRGFILRPFLISEKEKILNWAFRKNIPYLEDTSNKDISFDRNYIRHEMMIHVKRINPGVNKMVKKKILKTIKHKECSPYAFCPVCECDPCDCHGSEE